uniref:Uncharacterized protein n=1 Tax=Glossina palpalis gambiensis TaxID=67801 RepID=A0A1B0BFH0_9MUSC
MIPGTRYGCRCTGIEESCTRLKTHKKYFCGATSQPADNPLEHLILLTAYRNIHLKPLINSRIPVNTFSSRQTRVNFIGCWPLLTLACNTKKYRETGLLSITSHLQTSTGNHIHTKREYNFQARQYMFQATASLVKDDGWMKSSLAQKDTYSFFRLGQQSLCITNIMKKLKHSYSRCVSQRSTKTRNKIYRRFSLIFKM